VVIKCPTQSGNQSGDFASRDGEDDSLTVLSLRLLRATGRQGSDTAFDDP